MDYLNEWLQMEHSLEFCLNKRLEFFPLLTTGVQGKSYILLSLYILLRITQLQDIVKL